MKSISSAYGVLAQTYILSDAPTTMFLLAVSQMYDIACSIDDAVGICTACAWLTAALVVAGMPAKAARFSEQASDLADQMPTDHCIAPASYAKVWSNAGAGRLREATQYCLKAKEAFQTIGDSRRKRETHSVMTAFLISLGRFSEGIHMVEEILEEASLIHDKEIEVSGNILKGDLLMLRGDLEGCKSSEKAFALERDRCEYNGIDFSKMNGCSGVYAIALCIFGDFHKAANAVISKCAGGEKLRQYVFHTTDALSCSAALWEIDNFTRGSGERPG